ncbi:SRPBCC family protein [Chitinophagaceae bacterium MMS25-I14]
MKDVKIPCAEVQMLIRKPAALVFEAFTDPAQTKNFWFTKGSGRLEINKEITWTWEMYNVSSTVIAREIIQDRKITIDWSPEGKDNFTTVDFNFHTLSDGSTYVVIRHYGFDKTGDELMAAIKDSTSGFTTVVDGLKAWLEHGINLNLIADKFPREAVQHGN